MLAYSIPKDPLKDRWTPEVLDESLHVMHNFWPIPAAAGKGMDVLLPATKASVSCRASGDKWSKSHLGTGNQDNPKRAAAPARSSMGKLKSGKQLHRHDRAVARQSGRRLHRAERPGAETVGPARDR